MKVSGFSFVRNAIKFDYPVIEAISSILPICDEFILVLGNSEDDTENLIKSINSDKLKIVHSIWDENLKTGGKILAQQTNIALNSISKDSTWAFYIQADEVIHEKYLPTILDSMKKWEKNKEVEGLLFNYLHFYGSYNFVGSSRKWYRKEIRVIRPNIGVYSYRDAQGFRIENRKLNVKEVDAFVYHYGWVKSPYKQQLKQKYFNSLWHDDNWIEKNIPNKEEFDYSNIDSLEYFEGEHPKVIKEKIEQKNWKFDFDIKKKNFSLKDRILNFIEKRFNYRIGEYKNYKILK
ncbi:MAG: hypothetical protein LBM25_02160 [Bacteroidales bacterium]|nr:hypothetical protein [Bacteroidales bacterium]